MVEYAHIAIESKSAAGSIVMLFNGQTGKKLKICFSGKAMMNGLHIERDLLIALAEERGCRVDKRVKADTDFLVIPDEGMPSTTKAKKTWISGATKFMLVSKFMKLAGVT